MKFKFANGHSLQLWESEFTNLVISESEISYTRASGQKARILVPKCWLDNNSSLKGTKPDNRNEDQHETVSQSTGCSYSNLFCSPHSIQGLETPSGKGEFKTPKREIQDEKNQFSNFGREIKSGKCPESEQQKKVVVKAVVPRTMTPEAEKETSKIRERPNMAESSQKSARYAQCQNLTLRMTDNKPQEQLDDIRSAFEEVRQSLGMPNKTAQEQLDEDLKFAVQEYQKINPCFCPNFDFAQSIEVEGSHANVEKLFEQARALSLQGYDPSALKTCCQSFYLDDAVLREHANFDIEKSDEKPGRIAESITVEIFKRYASTIRQISNGAKNQLLARLSFEISRKIKDLRLNKGRRNPKYTRPK